MTDTPIDRESVERLADFLQDEDLHEEAQRHVADTLLALRAALDEAEARADALWSEVGRAAQEARAAALQEALDACTKTHTTGRLHGPKGVKAAILALLDKPHAEALERVRAEEREQCAEAADTYATAWDADPSDDYFKGWIRAAERIAATIRARGET